MPAYTRGVPRDVLTFVKVNSLFMYGWRAPDLASKLGISEADLANELGHMTVQQASQVAGALLVTGANSPKPMRVVKRDKAAPVTQAASTSTFMSFDKTVTATNAGWVISSYGRGVGLVPEASGNRSLTAVIELSNGALYCFSMNLGDFTLVKTALGLENAASITSATERSKLVTGSRTKPGRCEKSLGDGNFSGFYAPAAEEDAIADGFSIKTKERIEYAPGVAPAPPATP